MDYLWASVILFVVKRKRDENTILLVAWLGFLFRHVGAELIDNAPLVAQG